MMDFDSEHLNFCLVMLVIFLVLRIFYSACEYALIEVNDNKVKSLAEKDSKYKKLLNIISKPHKLMTAFSVHKVVSNIAVSLLSIVCFGERIYNVFLKIMPKTPTLIITSFILIFVVSVVIVVFADALPKRFANKNVEKLALASVGAVTILKGFYLPFSLIANSLTWLFCKIFGLQIDLGKDAVTEEEILMMVEVGNETGVIEETQREMINKIFKFDDAVVTEAMTHRTDLEAVEISSKITDVVYLAINKGYSRLPVYEKTIDNIVGVLCVKDLLCLVGCEHSDDFKISQFMRKVEFVHENAKCDDVLEKMTHTKTQMVIISDEYGGTLGVVTMEDLLEEIVGNIQDEYDNDESEFFEVDSGVFIIDGSADPEDIFPKLQVEIPENKDYDTMSAFFVDSVGHVPTNDENAEFIYKNIRFKVLLVEDNWVIKLKAEFIVDEEELNE